jgi:SAM-dependent methyltransferase
MPDVNELDVVELGCGTAYFGSWLARRGARVVGVDPTPAQLATARRMMQQTSIEFPLVEAPAESVPLPDSSFDLAVRARGVALGDPRWRVPAARSPARRTPHLPDELDPRLSCAPTDASTRRWGSAARPVRHVPMRGRRDRHRVPPVARRVGPAMLREHGFVIAALHGC